MKIELHEILECCKGGFKHNKIVVRKEEQKQKGIFGNMRKECNMNNDFAIIEIEQNLWFQKRGAI